MRYLLILVFLLILGCDATKQGMTETICKMQGGEWDEMRIYREDGDTTFYQCYCPDGGHTWIREGTKENCPDKSFAPENLHCEEDTDCMNSCNLGAVSVEWYESMQYDEGDCVDFCNGSEIDEPKCKSGRCVAYKNGWKNKVCTR